MTLNEKWHHKIEQMDDAQLESFQLLFEEMQASAARLRLLEQVREVASAYEETDWQAFEEATRRNPWRETA